jgi:succinate dehydrogenase / fumarate reductase membrane anchor subunit
MTGFRTPLGRARGLGSAKHGVGDFIGQRVSAVALLFLVAWGVWSAVILARGDYETARQWLAAPVNAVLVSLLALAGFFHMQIGMRAIIEDYIGRPATRTGLLILNALVCWGGAALTVVCLLKVAVGGGAI